MTVFETRLLEACIAARDAINGGIDCDPEVWRKASILLDAAIAQCKPTRPQDHDQAYREGYTTPVDAARYAERAHFLYMLNQAGTK